jgi:hypothetical protein
MEEKKKSGCTKARRHHLTGHKRHRSKAHNSVGMIGTTLAKWTPKK